MIRFIFLLVFFPQVGYTTDYNRDLFSYSPIAREVALVEQASRILWLCPYTGKLFTDSSELDADHIVPLKWAWDHGAEFWTDGERFNFANDPLNLLIVSASANRSKGSRGPLIWLPPNLTFAATYIHKFMTVCQKYDLSYPEEELTELYEKLKKYERGLRIDKISLKQ